MRMIAFPVFRGNRARRAPLGYSLIELMIAITISMVILAAMSWILVGNSRTRADIERQNAQIENGSYAMQVLNHDLQMAGYWAEYNIGQAVSDTLVPTPAVLPDPCSLDPADIAAAMPLSVQGYYQAATPTCISDVRANTDVIVVRRASGCVAGTVNCAPAAGAAGGKIYFQASSCNDSLELDKVPPAASNQFRISDVGADLTLRKKNCATLADQHEVLTHIYFVANNDVAGDGIPTLKRAEIDPANPAATDGWVIVSIAQGVENLRAEYGIDINGDRVPDVFEADPINATNVICAAAPCVNNFQNAMAVNVHLLVRNPTPTPGYTDNKTYTLGTKDDGTAYTVAGSGPFQRHAYTGAVRLINPSIR